MYRLAFQAFAANWPFFVLLSALSTILDELDLSRASLVPNFILAAFASFYSHRMVLLGERLGWRLFFKSSSPRKAEVRLGPFFLRLGAFLLAFCLIFFPLVWYAMSAGLMNTSDENSILAAVFLCLAVAAVPMGILISLFGTVLPAASIGEDASFDLALKRGRKTFWKTLFRLIFGYVLCLVLFLSIYLGVVLMWPNLLNGGAQYYVAMTLLSFGGYFTGLLAATALSMAYTEVEGSPAQWSSQVFS